MLSDAVDSAAAGKKWPRVNYDDFAIWIHRLQSRNGSAIIGVGKPTKDDSAVNYVVIDVAVVDKAFFVTQDCRRSDGN